MPDWTLLDRIALLAVGVFLLWPVLSTMGVL